MTVAVLIVNWNGGELLRRCLDALDRQDRPADHVVLVDNASTDDSLQLAGVDRRGVEVIRLPSNVGFARANNLAAAAARGLDALVLLNPDAFPQPDWLATLIGAADRRPEYASFASQLRFASDQARLDGAGDSYHVSGRAWRNGHGSRVADWPAGDYEVFAPCAAAALYRRTAWDDAGGFDERYFCYFEDVDLGYRLQLRGHRCLYVHAAVVDHVSSASSGYRSDFAVYHGERNMVWTFVKDTPGALLWRYLPQHLLLNLASLVYYPWRGQGRAVWRAKRDALAGLGAVWQQRRIVQQGRRVDVRTLAAALRHGVTAPYVRRYSP